MAVIATWRVKLESGCVTSVVFVDERDNGEGDSMADMIKNEAVDESQAEDTNAHLYASWMCEVGGGGQHHANRCTRNMGLQLPVPVYASRHDGLSTHSIRLYAIL